VPAILREQVAGLERAALIRTLARLPPGDQLSRPLTTTRAALRHQATDADTAGQLPASASDNPERMRPEAVAHLAGVAMIPASSGRTHPQ
jgi:hypothetical protein